MEVVFCYLVEGCGVYDELPSEWPVKFGMVGAIVGSCDLLDVSSGIFVGQDEAMLDIFTGGLLSFALDEGGN